MNLHIKKFKLRRNLSTTIELGIFIHLYGNWKVTFSIIANYAKDDAEITRREKHDSDSGLKSGLWKL